MEFPPCNLHRLIIPKPPIPFNYNRCPFWLIVCLHSEFLLILMHAPSHCILKTQYSIHITWKYLLMSSKKTYLSETLPCVTFVFFCVVKNICAFRRVCPVLLARRERTETSGQWWVYFSSVTAIHVVKWAEVLAGGWVWQLQPDSWQMFPPVDDALIDANCFCDACFSNIFPVLVKEVQ